MACSYCSFRDAAEQQFSPSRAAAEMTRYRQKGPGSTTRMLRDGLRNVGPIDGTLLDVGGGIGALTFELLELGVARALIVDASPAYLAAASAEANRRGRASAMSFVPGDFVGQAERLPAADLVTLDRVVCCYPDYAPLLQSAVEHAERQFAYSYPRDRWFVRLVTVLENALRRLRSNPFRTFVHPPGRMQAIIEAAGFTLASRRGTLAWSVDVFVKQP